MLNSHSTGLNSEGSGVLISGPAKRSWDWRVGLKKDSTPEQLLRVLRLAIAKELAGVWILDHDD
jgi:hypothetical protein